MAGALDSFATGRRKWICQGSWLPWGCRTMDEELGWLPGASSLNSSEFQPWLSLPCRCSCACTQDLGSVHAQSRLRNPSNTESLGVPNFSIPFQRQLLSREWALLDTEHS